MTEVKKRITSLVLNAKYRRNCLMCKQAFTYHPAAKDKGREEVRGLFCSWPCKSQHIKDNKPGPHTKVTISQCVTCGSNTISVRPKKYCSDTCKPIVAPRTGQLRKRDCAYCGQEYEYQSANGRPQWFCGDECKTQAKAAQRRSCGAGNKARRRAATVEKVDPFVVFDRDGWKCKMCGVDTPRELRGTYKDNAPEVDHIQPIAKGGVHSYLNTQCSCRKCNIKKSDKVLPIISSVSSMTSNVAWG